jgi:hypothetical protein
MSANNFKISNNDYIQKDDSVSTYSFEEIIFVKADVDIVFPTLHLNDGFEWKEFIDEDKTP